MSEYLLVIDEGTTSTRAMLFSPDGKVAASAQHSLTQHYPAPGHVEHDAAEIWERTLSAAREMVEAAGGAEAIIAIGITNQRETVVAWDRVSDFSREHDCSLREAATTLAVRTVASAHWARGLYP